MTTSDGLDNSGDRMRGAATYAKAMLEQVSGEGGILQQIEAGEWSRRLTAEQRTDVADLLTHMEETVRHGRAFAGSVGHPGDLLEGPRRSVEEALKTGLPLNRKKRFYTGTVLPMIVASDGFAHLDRLLTLCGLPSAGLEGNALEGYRPVQFFAEYNFAESCFTVEDKQRFLDTPLRAGSSDVVIAGPDWLLCIEAEMFRKARPADLTMKMNRQRILVDYWTRALKLDPSRVAHVLLVPERLVTTGVEAQVITWEAVLDAYRVVGPVYWIAVLTQALRHPEWPSRS